MTDIVKLRSEGKADNFSFIRFAEWRPQNLSAEITLEIPTLAQFLMDEHFSAVYFHLWLEISSLCVKNLTKICKRIEELLELSFSSAKENFRRFPPSSYTFGVTVHLLIYNNSDDTVRNVDESWSGDELKSTLNRGFSWDLEKRIRTHYNQMKTDITWDHSQWNLIKSLDLINSYILRDDDSKLVNYHGIMLSGWHTKGSFDQVIESQIESFSNKLKMKISFFMLAPVNKYINILSKAINLNFDYLLAENFNQVMITWKRKLLNNIEPKLEIEIEPNETWGRNFVSATNAALFQDVSIKDTLITFYNLKSIRYPIRVNYSFNLPLDALEKELDSLNPIVWDNLKLIIKTSSGTIVKIESLLIGKTYRLSQNNLEYQPERELNERIRLADNLKYRLEQLLNVQAEKNEIVKNLIAKPQLLEEEKNYEIISNSLNDIKLAFEILDYLEEEELLLAEIPPITKMFKPPDEDILNI